MDYSKARLLDPHWWRRHYILLSGMIKEDDLKIQQGVFDFHRALVANSGLSNDSFKECQEHARDAFYDMLSNLRPWEGVSAEDRKAKEIQDMQAAWFKAFNVDPNDPNWREENEKQVAQWRAAAEKRRKERPENDIERVYRRIRERQERIKTRKRTASTHKIRQGS